MPYQHIKISRDEPVRDRVVRPGFGSAKKYSLDEAKAHSDRASGARQGSGAAALRARVIAAVHPARLPARAAGRSRRSAPAAASPP